MSKNFKKLWRISAFLMAVILTITSLPLTDISVKAETLPEETETYVNEDEEIVSEETDADNDLEDDSEDLSDTEDVSDDSLDDEENSPATQEDADSEDEISEDESEDVSYDEAVEGDEHANPSDWAVFIYDGNKITGLASGHESDTVITIPYDCMIIGSNAFSGKQIKKVVYQNSPSTGKPSLTEIGELAFNDCPLTEIEIPENITKIGNKAYLSCSVATKVTIKSTKIGAENGTYIFDGCSKVTSVSIPDGTISIGANLFFGAGFDKDIVYTIPSSVTEIGKQAFKSTAFSKIVFAEKSAPDSNGNITSLLSIGESAFEEAEVKTPIVLPTSLTTIGKSSFKNSKGFFGSKDFVIPAKVNIVYDYAFMTCADLTSVTIESSELQTFGTGVFKDCSNLENIVLSGEILAIPANFMKEATVSDKAVFHIPYTVTNIGNYAFQKANISEFIFDDNDKRKKGSTLTIGDNAFEMCPFVEFEIPECTVSIGNNAFKGTKEWKDIVIPSNVTNIGLSAFENCIGAESLTIDTDKLVTVGNNAFKTCTAVETVVLSENMASIPANLFYGSQFSNNIIHIPNNVRTIGKNAFYNSYVLDLDFGEESKLSVIDESAFENSHILTTENFPASLTEIRRCAFKKCLFLENMVIPEGVTKIENQAFYDCGAVIRSLEIRSSKITSCGTQIFYHDGYFENLILSEDMTVIPANLFNGSELSFCGIDIPKKCKEIGAKAFYDSGITRFNFPELTAADLKNPEITGVQIIGDQAFAGTHIVNIDLPDSVKTIGESAFQQCDAMKSIVIPEGCTSIGQNAFAGCQYLIHITIPDSVEFIGDGSFVGVEYDFKMKAGANSYAEAWAAENGIPVTDKDYKPIGTTTTGTIPAPADWSIFVGGNGAISGLKDNVVLTNGELVIPNDCYVIAKNAFQGNEKIEKITFQKGSKLECISASAFEGCTGITEITIPENMIFMGGSVFKNCTNLKKITINSGILCYEKSSNRRKENYDNFAGCVKVEDITFSDNMTKIPGYLFYMSSIKDEDRFSAPNIHISDSIREIQEYAFYQSKIGMISYGDNPSLERIGQYAFYRGTYSSEINLSDSLKGIGDYAFAECIGIDSVTLPASLTGIKKAGVITEIEAIGNKAFEGCTALKTVVIKSPFNEDSVVDGYAFNNCKAITSITFDVPSDTPIYIPDNLFNNSNLNSIDFEIPANVVVIGKNAFKASGFKNISIKNVGSSILKEIKDSAFDGCSMTSFTLPNSLEKIGKNAFANCKLLSEITIPKNVTEIQRGAFSYCYGAEKLVYNATNVTKCDVEIFRDCTAVKTVTIGSNVTAIPENLFNETKFGINSITIPAGVKSIGKNAFYKSNFVTVSFPTTSALEVIGESAFAYCNFTSFTIPTSVKTISRSAFSYCPNLKTMVIPSNVSTIGGNAFANCSNLISIDFKAVNFTIDSGAFTNDIALSSITLPSGMTVIPKNLFYNAKFTSVQKITIPAAVTEIGQSAFDSSGIQAFEFASDSKLTTVGSNAFKGNDKVETILLPDSVNSIGSGAFSNCGALKNFTVPTAMTTFYTTWFTGDKNLEWIGIPATVGKVTNKENHSTQGFSGTSFSGCNVGLFIKTTKDSPAYHWCIKNKIPYEFKVLIDYHMFGGINSSANPTMYSPKDESITFANPQSRPGYTFGGWYADEGFSKKVTGTKNYTVKETTEKIDVYAKWIKQTYTITYQGLDADGVVEPIYALPKTYTVTDRVDIPAPERYGYEFTGWDVYQNSVIVLSKVYGIEPNTVSGNLILKPTWNANEGTYAIILNPNGGVGSAFSMPNLSLFGTYVIRNSAMDVPFTKEGYFIAEWNTKKDGKGVSYYDGEKVSNIASKDGEIINLYAIWEKENDLYNISYVFDDGLEVTANANPDTRKAGAAVTLKKPTVKGYVFDGWFADKEYTISVKSIDKTTVGNTVLFAKCTPVNYTVTFNGNGTKTGATGSIPATYDVDVTLPENGFLRPGYTFVGWNTKANGTGDAYAVNGKAKNLAVKNNAKAVLYAQWKVEEYTVTFNVDGGTAIAPAKYTVAKALSLPKPVKEGYTFAGWFSDEAKLTKVKSIAKGSTGNKTVYAKWTENKYTVKFNANGATGKLSLTSFTPDYTQEFLLLNEDEVMATKTGCAFKGWNTAKDGSGTHYDAGAKVSKLVSKAKGSLTLYAEWEVSAYTLTYNINGGKGTLSKTTESCTPLNKINLITGEGLTKNGYSFTGWNTAKNGKGKNFEPGEYSFTELSPKSGANKITLYANWVADEYTITYNDGGSLPASAKFVGVKGLKLPTPKKNGYTFGGWYSDPDFSKKVKSIAKNTFTNKAVYAKWTENKYTLTINANGGKAKASKISLRYTDSIKLTKEAVKRDGYTLKGFALKKNATVPDYAVGSSITGLSAKKNGKVTLYAIWQIDVHKITYNLNGGSYNNNGKNPSYCSVAKDVTLKAPVREGYKFTGWYCEQLNTTYPVRISKIKKSNMKSFYKNGAPIDITLKAMWVKE